jgi:dynein heavy chain
MGLIAEDGFVKKCIDLQDILDVRHCCFIIGPPGCGKTTVWKTLLQSLKRFGQDG